jgi:DNA-binding transcriptional ArsR family regulator
MIHVRLRVGDLGRMRFSLSPLVEVAESLYMLSSGKVEPVHRGWYAAIRHRLHMVDLELLHAVVPARSYIADFLLPGATYPARTMADQLDRLARMPADRMGRDIEDAWQGEALPMRARRLAAAGSAGPGLLANALAVYWTVAIEPYWRNMRAVLDDDVAFRVAALTRSGLREVLADLHPQICIRDEEIRIDKRHTWQQDLSGAGLLLVPSVFTWPNVIFEPGCEGPASLTYAVRGVGKIWGPPQTQAANDDALGALLGRSRAAILTCLELPHSTTELALKLGQSPPSVSQHLSVLRRSDLVTSWRSGRSVLYRRTALASSLVEASAASAAAG